MAYGKADGGTAAEQRAGTQQYEKVCSGCPAQSESQEAGAACTGTKPELLHHQKFFENGTAERAKESGTEQNYNMIDGCVNNVPKKPRRIGGRWSVLDRLHIKQAERRQKDNAPQQEQERSRKS